jgi:hypothetical protein
VSRLARILAPALGVVLAAAPAGAFEPTDRYRKESLQGYTVRLAPQAVANKIDCDALVRELDLELKRINRVVPDKALKVLQGVTIWVEWDTPAEKRAVARFFPSVASAKKTGVNPDKGDGVEVPNLKRYLKARQDGAEWVAMHEMAHAYHYLALQDKDGDIQTAHKQAVDRKLYDDVEHFNGARGRGYAVTNHWEYFATLSEAYFGKSFNYPYDRPGLLRYDTAGYYLMVDAWGKPK